MFEYHLSGNRRSLKVHPILRSSYQTLQRRLNACSRAPQLQNAAGPGAQAREPKSTSLHKLPKRTPHAAGTRGRSP